MPIPSETEAYWNPAHLYHGTSEGLKPGDKVEPGHAPNYGGGESMDPRHTHAYVTPHIRSAWEYAENAAARRGGRPRVYEVGRAHDMMPDPESGHAVGGPQMIPEPGWRSRTGFPVLRELEHHELAEHTAAAHWAPSSGIFAPTTGLDHRLFDGRGRLRPAVRGAIMEKLDLCLRTDTGLTGSDWQGWLKVYLAGGSASEWAGSRPHEAAQDLDVLIGVDYSAARSNTPEFRTMTDSQIDAALNAGLRGCFNTDGWHPEGFEGTWDVTAYVNPQAWDIRSLRPYAAWDVSDSRWAVRPPHLPDHTLGDFNPAVLAEARAIATEARAILRLPEPLRTREAIALWERLHADRRAAFSGLGEGWTDPGNVAEKWLAYAPGNLLGRVRELALGTPHTAEGLRSVRPSDLDDAEQRLAPSRWEAPTERTGALEVRADAATPVGSPYTYEHDAYDGGTHWFSAQHPDAGEVGHAQVEEKEGPGGPHVEIKRLETDADHRGHGIGTQLLSNVEKHFPGRELRLKPYPLDEDGDQSTEDLEEYYGGRGFEHRPLREGEPTELYDYMHKQAAVTGYTGLTGHSGMIYLELPEDAVHHLKGGVDDHHITVVYLGKNISDEAFEEACRRAEQAARQSRPMSGFLRGVETFEQGDGSRGKTPVFVPAYVPGIGHLRSLLEDLNGSQHRQYRPHVTLAYLGEDDDLPKAHPKVDVRFDRLHVKRGDDVVSFPLGPSQ